MTLVNGWRLFAAILLFVLATSAQQKNEYTATCTGNLADASTGCTIQLPASSDTNVIVSLVFVECSVQCSVTQERDGTTATATAVTARKINPGAAWVPAALATIYQASNSASGTPVGPEGGITVAAAPNSLTLDTSAIILERGAAGVRNYTARATAGSGTYKVTIKWEQRASL